MTSTVVFRWAALGALVVSLSTAGWAARAAREWPAEAFKPLTAERIGALPEAERGLWQAYWAASEAQLRQLRERPKPDASSLVKLDAAPKGGAHIRGLELGKDDAWYASAAARQLADHIVAAQTPFGGWSKGNDYAAAHATEGEHGGWSVGTFDNDATTTELRFLARAITAVGEEKATAAWRAAFATGLRYIFSAQYPNGGFPQIYPLIGGYHDGVTYNDDAMVHVLELLRGVAGGAEPFAFVGAAEREACAMRLGRGVRCILATQLRGPGGELTAWCQQYDPLTLRAAAARNFEPIADCSGESARIVLLLMRLPHPSPEIVAAVDGAVAWFRKTALKDLKVARAPADMRGEAVPSPGAPPLWARFYEPGTTTPIFGDRDRTIHYDLGELSVERVRGYSWYNDVPAGVLSRYEKWRGQVK